MKDDTTENPPLVRQAMRARLDALPPAPARVLRPPPAADVEALAALLYQAYLGTLDYVGESEADAVSEVQRTFAGDYGEFLPQYSRLAEQEATLASAALITRLRGQPLVAFTVTHPRYQRIGLARACLACAMHALASEGESELSLVVTLANIPAVMLYERLGFVFVGSQTTTKP
jgi:GNAT superfamily N-acetyltransferase